MVSKRNEIGEDKKQEENKTENHFKKKTQKCTQGEEVEDKFQMKMKTNGGDVAKLIEENRRQG